MVTDRKNAPEGALSMEAKAAYLEITRAMVKNTASCNTKEASPAESPK